MLYRFGKKWYTIRKEESESFGKENDMARYEERRNALRALFKKNGFDGILIVNPANIYYYTGFYGDDSKVFLWGEGVALLTDGRYTEQAARECPDVPLLIQSVKNGSWLQLLEKSCRKQEMKRLAFEGDFITYQEYAAMKEALAGIALADSGDILSAGRLIKEEEEIRLLQRVAEIGDQVLASIEKYLKPGITEKELAREIDYAFLKLGAEGVSFPTIVAAGKNGAKPHAKPSDYAFAVGDFVTIDMGGRYEGYCGDMTRTFAIGFADDRHRELYELVLRAQDYAEKHIRPGMTAGEADALARNILTEAGYGAYFSHSLGHGVGLEIHEAPSLRPGDDYILRPGNVITIEPGVYIGDFGGVRIENTVLVTEKGTVPLNHYPKTLRIF